MDNYNINLGNLYSSYDNVNESLKHYDSTVSSEWLTFEVLG